jgi:hypothetical protein
MEKTKKIIPSITLNGKEYCINVGRDVVRALGYPSHICILEYDKWQVMAITPCDESDPLSFQVPEGFPDGKMKKFRIYSQSLVREIIEDCKFNLGEVYNLKGEYIEAMNAVLFRLNPVES